jgi:hypothetical protein
MTTDEIMALANARILTRLPGDEWCAVIDAAMEHK